MRLVLVWPRCWLGACSILRRAWCKNAGLEEYLGKTGFERWASKSRAAMVEPGKLEMVETRVDGHSPCGEIRSGIDHLFGLGRFEDVRVRAPSPIRECRCADR